VNVNSNLRILSIACLILISLNSCYKKNDVIPDVRVDFSLDLYDPEFVTLSAIGNHIIVTSQTNNLGSRAAGYDYNGIIVYCVADIYNNNTSSSPFYAYDRTCPHDFAVNGLSVKVNVGDFWAICPQCSTKYSLFNGGFPESGPGKFPLKNYRTSFDNNRIIRVWN
jgi:hypothetical protein